MQIRFHIIDVELVIADLSFLLLVNVTVIFCLYFLFLFRETFFFFIVVEFLREIVLRLKDSIRNSTYSNIPGVYIMSIYVLAADAAVPASISDIIHLVPYSITIFI